jgi:hypothetical protein
MSVDKQDVQISQPLVTPNAPIVTNTPKLTDYRCFYLPDLKNVYLKMLNDNITQLIDYIYQNREKEPYNSTEVRISLSMQMILSSNQLIPIQLSTLIAKDIDALRKNDEYTNRWANPAMKRKRLVKEMEILKKHTEIDDSISLNLADKSEPKPNLVDFDIHSGVSTLNVSATCPISDDDGRGGCMVM